MPAKLLSRQWRSVVVPIAQLNLSRARWPIDDERMHAFSSRIDEVNAVADAAPGFLWRLKAENGQGSSYVNAFDDPHMLVNLSAWVSVEALAGYVLSDAHRNVMTRRAEWFEPGTTRSIVWDIDEGHTPDLDEALGMLESWEQGEGPARDMRKLLARARSS